MLNILEESGALLEGHFLLTSGRHSNRYVQCAKVLRYPDKAEKILKPVADRLKELNLDLVVGPAMGGIIVAYEIGRQLGLEAIFTERVDGEMKLRRGFEIKAGSRVAICEDVVTTAKSSLEVKRLLESLGAEVVALASIIDRTNDNTEFNIISAVKLEIETFDKENCPMCAKGIPYEKPGSRVKIY